MFFIIILKKVATEISAGGPPSRILGVSKSDENLLFWLFQKLAAKHDPGIGDLGGQMLPIFLGDPNIGLFLSTCCRKKFLAPGDPPTTPQKYSEMMFLPSKKPQMGIFSILSVENRVLERWGGAAQLWAGKKLCSPNKSKITQKKISDRAHPLPCEIGPSKMPVLTNRKSQN